VEKAFRVKYETAMNIEIVDAGACCHHPTLLLCNQIPDSFPHGCLSQEKRREIKKKIISACTVSSVAIWSVSDSIPRDKIIIL
jgi:hypothetical protein